MMKEAGTTITINVQGSYVKIENNENVYLTLDGKQTDLNVKDAVSQSRAPLRTLFTKEEYADKMIPCMQKLLQGQKGKMAALIVLCAMHEDLNLFSVRPTYEQMKDEFGDIGSRNGYYHYLKVNFTPDEKLPVTNALQSHLPTPPNK